MPHILVAEDEPTIRLVLREYLTLEGYQITEAKDGAEALSLLDTGIPIDLLVADLFMPNTGGKEVIETLRKTPKRESLPVILLTGAVFSKDHFPPKGSYSGVMAKPFDLDDLLRLIKKVLANSDSASCMPSSE